MISVFLSEQIRICCLCCVNFSEAFKVLGEGKENYRRIESFTRTLVDARLKNLFNKSASANKMCNTKKINLPALVISE